MITNSHLYQVDGEVGRFVFATHSVVKKGGIEYNSAQSIFPELTGKEWYKTSGFKELGMIYGTIERSYRKTREMIKANSASGRSNANADITGEYRVGRR